MSEILTEGNIQETLGKRSPVYGPYGEQVIVRRDIVDIMLAAYNRNNNVPMPHKYQEYIWDIANKLSRIATTPQHIDSWHDIQGYAKLIELDLLKSGEGV